MGVRASRETEYTEYVQGRLAWLRRTAYLLCQDWQQAESSLQAGFRGQFAPGPGVNGGIFNISDGIARPPAGKPVLGTRVTLT